MECFTMRNVPSILRAWEAPAQMVNPYMLPCIAEGGPPRAFLLAVDKGTMEAALVGNDQKVDPRISWWHFCRYVQDLGYKLVE
jgi:hypothetical protein